MIVIKFYKPPHAKTGFLHMRKQRRAVIGKGVRL